MAVRRLLLLVVPLIVVGIFASSVSEAANSQSFQVGAGSSSSIRFVQHYDARVRNLTADGALASGNGPSAASRVSSALGAGRVRTPLTPDAIAADATEGLADAGADDSTVFRVHGGDSAMGGQSWTTQDPPQWRTQGMNWGCPTAIAENSLPGRESLIGRAYPSKLAAQPHLMGTPAGPSSTSLRIPTCRFNILKRSPGSHRTDEQRSAGGIPRFHQRTLADGRDQRIPGKRSSRRYQVCPYDGSNRGPLRPKHIGWRGHAPAQHH